VSDIRAFLPHVTSESTARPLGATLRTIATAPATSPWSPKAAHESPSLPAIDTAAIEAEARERGRVQGLAETAELRTRLSAAIDAFTTARESLRAPAADSIATAACAVVAGWARTANARELYEPLVRTWLEKQAGAAVAEVHPSDADAARELFGASVTVTSNATLARGDIRISASTLELAFSWERSLGELRALIAAALEEKP
jgi:flagellar biosynthesis/type III secretory pathway protein FliH